MPVTSRNPPNPYHATDIDWEGEPPLAPLEVFEERARSILSTNESPDMPFRYSLNPYRGCYHGCAYCYARPSHQYLDWGAGSDFERRIVAKVNAPELLRAELDKRSWKGETVMFSGVTDCYQPLEANYRLTRQCLELFRDYRNPVSIVTKGATVLMRDVALLGELAQVARCHVTLSIAFADDETSRQMEPWCSPPSKRFAVMRALADAGVSVSINVAPVIPGLNDADIATLLERAAEHGATRAALILLRLPREVLPVFDERLETEFGEDRANKVRSAIRQMRGGKMNDPNFGSRMRGDGPRWGVISQLFETQCRRLGLDAGEATPVEVSTFRRPTKQAEFRFE